MHDRSVACGITLHHAQPHDSRFSRKTSAVSEDLSDDAAAVGGGGGGGGGTAAQAEHVEVDIADEALGGITLHREVGW